MPRFAANLAYLFAERPFMERFGAASAAGFKAVELQFPYDQAPSAIRSELDRYGLTQLGINTAPRPNGGESGLGAVPGRERDAFGIEHDPHRGHRRVVVEHRFALAHENDVRLRSELCAIFLERDQHLPDDFSGREVADQS